MGYNYKKEGKTESFRTQELSESRGGRSPYDLCGVKQYLKKEKRK